MQPKILSETASGTRPFIALKHGVEAVDQDGVRVYLPDGAINPSDAKEFAANDRHEQSVREHAAGRLIFDDIAFKSDFIRTFQVLKHLIDLSDGQRVLELGSAHGWASAMIKCDFPKAYVVASDLVPDCVRHCGDYERVLGTEVDEKWAFSVRDIPFADAQFDRIFTFASFHHFGDNGDYSQALREIARLLRPGGKLVLLYEPSSPRFLYRRAHRRVNRRRHVDGVDEDVLVVSKLKPLAEAAQLSLIATPFPFAQYRSSATSTIYYYLLSKLRLARLLVCTTNIVIKKRQ